MAAESKEIKQLTEAIKILTKKLEQGSETTSVSNVERTRKLEKSFEKYIEQALIEADVEGAFKALKTGIVSNLEKIGDQAQENLEKATKEIIAKQASYKKSIEAIDEEIANNLKNLSNEDIKYLKEERAKLVSSFDNQKIQIEKLTEKFQEEYSKTFYNLQENLSTNLKESIKEYGEKTFKTTLASSGDVNVALKNYRKALVAQYNDIKEDKKFREELGITDENLDEVKREIYDSYLAQLANQAKNLSLDEKTRAMLEDKLKKEKILLGQSTYEQTYGGSPLGKLAGRLADFTSKRYKQQTSTSSEFTKTPNELLGAFFKGKEEEFLPTKPGKSVKTRGKGRTLSAQGGSSVAAVNPGTTPAVDVSTEQQSSPVNESPVAEKIGEVQQTLEQATENVPLKTIITGFDTNAEKQLSETFSEAVQDSIKDALSGVKPGAIQPEKPKKKSKQEGGSGGGGIGLGDILGLKGLGKGAIGLAKGAYGFATGGLGLGGLLGTNVGAIGSLGAGAMLTSGLLAAGTAYGGYKAGEALEENFGLGTSLLQNTPTGMLASKLYAGKTIDQIEKEEESNEKLNEKLQKASEIKDPIDKKLAYFNAQKESLESEVKTKSGEEQAEAKKRLESVNRVIVKLEKQKQSAAAIKQSATEQPAITTTSTPQPGPNGVSVETIEKNNTFLPSVPPAPQQNEQVDVKPELDTNNKLTSNTNELLGRLITVVEGKNTGPSTVTPLVVPAATSAQQDIQTQSPAYQFRAQNRI